MFIINSTHFFILFFIKHLKICIISLFKRTHTLATHSKPPEEGLIVSNLRQPLTFTSSQTDRILEVFITFDLIDTLLTFSSSLIFPISLPPSSRSLLFSPCGAVDITDCLYPPADLILLKNVNYWGSLSPLCSVYCYRSLPPSTVSLFLSFCLFWAVSILCSHHLSIYC